MNALEKRIMQVSKMVADYNLEATLNFDSVIDGSRPVDDAMDILSPELEDGHKAITRIFDKHGVWKAEDLLTQLECAVIHAAYTVGVVAGLHLAGRPEIVPALAKAYAGRGRDDFTKYDEDGNDLRLAETQSPETRN